MSRKYYRRYINFNCLDCDIELNIRSDYFNKHSGKCISCGKKNNSNAESHGESKTRLYRIWTGLSQRRYSTGDIEVCKDWNDYITFKKWSLLNGYKNNLTIDRIDNTIGYNPKNCQWITLEENSAKDKIIFKNEEKLKLYRERKRLNITQKEMAELMKVSRNTIQRAEKFAKEFIDE